MHRQSWLLLCMHTTPVESLSQHTMQQATAEADGSSIAVVCLLAQHAHMDIKHEKDLWGETCSQSCGEA